MKIILALILIPALAFTVSADDLLFPSEAALLAATPEEAPDGSIYVSYDWERSRKGHILFAKFTEEDILAGELVHPESRLKQIIVKPGKLNAKQPEAE